MTAWDGTGDDGRRVRVVHLTAVHPARDTRIFHRECSTLACHGYRVTLVVPHGREEVDRGVTIRPLPRPRSRLERIVVTTRRVLAVALREAADIYHYHDPELMPAALALAARGTPVIADVHEDVPADIRAKRWLPLGTRSSAAALGRSLQAVAGRSAAAVIAATPAIARRLPGARPTVVRNYPDLRQWTEPEAPDYHRRPLRVAYVGRIEADRGVREMVRAMEALGEVAGAHLAMAGEFSPPRLEREPAALPGWSRVERRGFLPRSGVVRLLRIARIGLVLPHPRPNHLEAEPNKLFEYMAAGLPVVASDFPRWRELVAGIGCGLLVDPLDPGAIARAIRTLLEDPDRARAMGRRGREAVVRRFNWDREAPKLLAVYRGLAGRAAAVGGSATSGAGPGRRPGDQPASGVPEDGPRTAAQT